jgi:hypothetical protein
MRFNDKGIMRTLDQDIIWLWKEHGWEVITIKCPEKHTWEVKATYKGRREMTLKDMLMCQHCGKPLKKVGNYEYKWDCGCVNKNMRLSVG